MGIIKILLWGRRPSRPTGPTGGRSVSPSKQQTEPTGSMGTPIHSVRRKFWLRGCEYGVNLNLESARNSLAIGENAFIVSLCPATRANFELFMENWYRRQARKAFQAATERWLPLFHARGHEVPVPRLKIYHMRRAWGRCYYTKGLITMNLHLVKTPQACIDYIILHELCHFVVSNHSKDFYRLVESFMPDWREADKLLKSFAREHRILG